uniref:Ovule protein n=1 Tax=Steinernema glaseri TaxID=37863 RepID=A0A1I7YKL0_9BILA
MCTTSSSKEQTYSTEEKRLQRNGLNCHTKKEKACVAGLYEHQSLPEGYIKLSLPYALHSRHIRGPHEADFI